MVGQRLLLLARAWFDETTVSRVFEPLLADWQRECVEATGRDRTYCLLRGYVAFASAFATALPRQVLQRLPVQVTMGGWFALEAFAALGIVAQVYVIQGGFPHHASYLLPATLTTALPLALIPVTLILVNMRRIRPHEARVMLLRLALITMMVIAPMITWITPNANQQWRQFESGYTNIWRGMREMTVPELFATNPPPDQYEANGMWPAARSRELTARASVLLMPITATVFALSISAIVGRFAVVWAVALWAVVGIAWLSDIYNSWAVHLVLLATAAAARYDAEPCDLRQDTK